MKVFKLSLLFLIYMLIGACEPIDTNKIDWKPELLAPIIKSKIDMYDFEALKLDKPHYDINAGNLNITGYDLNKVIPIVPAINSWSGLPKTNLELNTFFNLIVIDSAAVTINFQNVFPIPFGKDTRLTIKDSVSQELLSEHYITHDVAAGDSYSFDFYIFDKQVSKTIEIHIAEFNSPGGTDITFTNEILEINIEIQFVNLDWIEISNDVDYTITTQSEVDFNTDGDADPFSGTASIFLDNNFPTDFNLHLDLYDDMDNFVYSFFDATGLKVKRGVLSPTGKVIESTKMELLNFIHSDKIPLLETATKLKITANFQTRSTPISNIIDDESYIELQITGNSEIAIQDL